MKRAFFYMAVAAVAPCASVMAQFVCPLLQDPVEIEYSYENAWEDLKSFDPEEKMQDDVWKDVTGLDDRPASTKIA